MLLVIFGFLAEQLQTAQLKAVNEGLRAETACVLSALEPGIWAGTSPLSLHPQDSPPDSKFTGLKAEASAQRTILSYKISGRAHDSSHGGGELACRPDDSAYDGLSPLVMQLQLAQWRRAVLSLAFWGWADR